MLSLEQYQDGARELTLDDARRLTERIRITAASVAEGVEKLKALVAEAKAANVHEQLGYASWTAYLADVLGETPMRLARDDRPEISRMLTDEGMSTRAAAKVLGVSDFTIRADTAGARNLAPEPAEGDDFAVDESTGEVIEFDAYTDAPTFTAVNSEAPETAEHTETTKTITGLDGKTYKASEPSKPRRRPLTDQARTAGWDLRKAIERIERIVEDDRFGRNKEEVATQLRSHLQYAIETCQGLIDGITTEEG